MIEWTGKVRFHAARRISITANSGVAIPPGNRHMKRLAIFAHYDQDNLLDDYVLYYLAGLRRVIRDIIFVSTSTLSEESINRLKTICRRVILKENVGYDFGSWRAALEAAPELSTYDEVIICNDSTYAPLFPFDEIFDKMRVIDCDFWGMTDSTESADTPYHLQSYFLAFRRPVIASSAFKDFWQSVKSEPDKGAIIRKYEVGLTQTLLKAGFRPAVYARHTPSVPNTLNMRIINMLKRQIIKSLKGNPLRAVNPFKMVVKWALSDVKFDKKLNIMFFFIREMIAEYRAPLLKIWPLRHRPMKIELTGFSSFLQKQTDFPMSLIFDHLKRVGRHGDRIRRFWQ